MQHPTAIHIRNNQCLAWPLFAFRLVQKTSRYSRKMKRKELMQQRLRRARAIKKAAKALKA